MKKVIKLGTRESQLAVWQANKVSSLLAGQGYTTELVYIKSEGDTDLTTPLYELGVQGIFTKALDIALLDGRIDIAVHSMKDVPTQLAKGLVQAAVLERASYKDIFVPKEGFCLSDDRDTIATIATSSIRRKAQWLNRYPKHIIEPLRGNVNTRLHKVATQTWQGAIFAAAGLERISLRPQNAIDLDWMLPAPAQGAITIACREDDEFCLQACKPLNHSLTELCTKIERDFLRALLGGCSTPISGLATAHDDTIQFSGNILSVDGKQKIEVNREAPVSEALNIGIDAADSILGNGGELLMQSIRNAG